ncbi:DHA2 family efflux MFS transporter permease subunit [Mariprofundus erugo]|uniref:DHA2 family efflux MFS transporter permease subunit n=1 Tax=Mariprofundus erugo TaxID=2528639 RepID=A0A5R9GP82_9PROT|nr:DHA2 family efflux MFS transporter permease subunit [Mariprofundus erugo]TLS66233.1 DHA2 family efflux MFS transporter permease subunit [Mariprofundus erugo]
MADHGESRVAHPGLITFSVMLATVMQVLDTTIVNVALPHMQGALSATQDQIAWLLTSYIVATAIATPLTGWASGRLGRKRVFMWSVAVFTLMSLFCGIAGSLSEMVLFRVLQGIAGAALVPLSQSILLDAYPREKHGSAMALWGVGIMIGPILGPTLGGYLTEYANWRWVFFINLPVGVLAWVMIGSFVSETRRHRDIPFDMIGFAFLSLGIGALQLMLDRGERLDWFDSGEIVVEAALALLGFYIFTAHAATTQHPFLSLRLLADRNYATSLLFIFIVGIILFATLALMPPFMEQLLGYPVLMTGLLLAPRGLGTMISMMVVGRLMARIDPRWIIITGFLLTAESLWEMSGFNLDVSDWDLVRTGIVQGLGLGAIFVPLSAIAYATLEPEYRNEAASVFSLLRNLGSSVGISIMVAQISRSMQENHLTIAESINPFNPWFWQQGMQPVLDPASQSGLAVLNAMVVRQAGLIAYTNDFVVMMWLALLTAPLVLMLKGRPAGGK